MKHIKNLLFIILVAITSNSICAQNNIKFVSADSFPLYGKVKENSLNRYERLPETLKENVRPDLWYLGRNSAGLYLRFRSNSSSIHAKWTATTNMSMNHMTDTGTKGLDLYCLVKGEWRHVCSARPSGKENQSKIIDNMTPEYREYLLYLSLYDGVQNLEIGIDKESEIAAPQVQLPLRDKVVVMYGTSILQGGCASRPGMAHTNIIGRMLNREVINLGFSGNALLDLEIAHYMASVEKPGVFVLDYVPNASAQMINSIGEEFFYILRKSHPNVPIIFIEDPIFPSSLFDKNMQNEVETKNAAQKELFKKLKKKGEKYIYYIDADNLIGRDGEATVDGIHFTDLGATRYVENVLPIIKKALKKR